MRSERIGIVGIVALIFLTHGQSALGDPAAGGVAGASAGPTAEPSVSRRADSAPVVRRFAVVNRPLDEAYRLISPLLSEQAEVRVLRAQQTLEVRDEAARLLAVAAALTSFDVAARRVRVSVRLVKGERLDGDAPVAGGAGDGGGERLVPRDVRELVAFNSFETLGSIDLATGEGLNASGFLGSDDRYRIDVAIGSVDKEGGAIPLDSLALAKKAQGSDGRNVYRPVLQFKEVLQNGRTRVLFATPSSSDRRALFLVLVGTIE